MKISTAKFLVELTDSVSFEMSLLFRVMVILICPKNSNAEEGILTFYVIVIHLPSILSLPPERAGLNS